jgi:hypothetical protein
MGEIQKPHLELLQGEGLGPTHRETPNWRHMGHCAMPGLPASVMAPAPDNFEGVARAKAYCVGCIVVKRCLEYGLRMSPQIDFGIWGGTTPEERVAIRGGQSRLHGGRFPPDGPISS